MNTLQPGKYQHYKGAFYEVLGVAIHSETLEELVLYKMLYSSEKYPENTLWIRPLTMFTETIEINGEAVPRFKLVSSNV